MAGAVFDFTTSSPDFLYVIQTNKSRQEAVGSAKQILEPERGPCGEPSAPLGQDLKSMPKLLARPLALARKIPIKRAIRGFRPEAERTVAAKSPFRRI
jgi:hypothetical protein